MRNICRVCGNEKKYDCDRGVYVRCGPCNSRKVLRCYYNKKDICLERNRKYYQNNKEYFREYYKKRNNKIKDLENQVKQLSELLQTVTVS